MKSILKYQILIQNIKFICTIQTVISRRLTHGQCLLLEQKEGKK